MRILAVRLLIIGAVLVSVAGCRTTGDIPVAILGNQPIYISPANADGIQDAVSFDLSVMPLERTILKRYAVTVTTQEGDLVLAEEVTVPSGGVRRRDRRAALIPPDVVLWDGRDGAGEFAPDGEYSLAVQVWDNRDNTGVAPPQRIIVDNTLPYLELSAPFRLFTPNGDDRLDSLALYQRNSTNEELWTGVFLNATGDPVREFTWSGAAGDFAWDGTTAAGGTAPEGSYSYSVSAADPAGNSAVYSLSEIALEREPRPIAVAVSRRVFSPNGDGAADTVTLTPSVTVSRNIGEWSIAIRDIGGRPLRTINGSGVPISVEFDGLDDSGSPLADGQYLAVFTVRYTGGQAPRTASPVFRVDTAPPRATVAVSTVVFSPDGDGLKDNVEVLQSSSTESTWTGRLERTDGSVIRVRNWAGQAQPFVWDGTDANGRLLPDGEYIYRLESIDSAENRSVPAAVRVRLDTRPVPVRIAAASQGFSPNGDGLSDVVTLNLGASVSEGVAEWRVSVRNSSNRTVGDVVSGVGPLPSSVQWDGNVAGRRVPDGLFSAELVAVYQKGNISTATSDRIRVDTNGPEVSVRHAPVLFSPDADGTDDMLTLTIAASDQSTISRWSATVLDPTGQAFRTWSGSGAPPRTIQWDGYSQTRELVQSAEDYTVVVTATDSLWNNGRAESTIPVDILVLREGDRLRIRISSIYFVPFTADYVNLEDAEQARHNLETLDRLAFVLKKYPRHSIRIEGHAVSLYWANPVRAEREHREVLIPLSEARAAAIRAALIDRGVVPQRMTTAGLGGAAPVVPHGDERNRWKNRRVEFILER